MGALRGLRGPGRGLRVALGQRRCRRRAGRGWRSHLRLGVQGDEVLVLVQQLAGVGDVHGRLLLVAGEDPDLQAGLPQLDDGLGDPVLQAVFDPGGAWSEAPQCR